jgi:hypothetical protein
METDKEQCAQDLADATAATKAAKSRAQEHANECQRIAAAAVHDLNMGVTHVVNYHNAVHKRTGIFADRVAKQACATEALQQTAAPLLRSIKGATGDGGLAEQLSSMSLDHADDVENQGGAGNV